MSEKIPITIRLNKNVHEALKKYKKLSGMSISSQCYAAISSWLFQKKLLSLDDISGHREKPITKASEPMPEGVKYCDGPSCEIDWSKPPSKKTDKLKYGLAMAR